MKCDHCSKKVKLITFDCKCDYKTLCIKCKMPEDHSCKAIEEFQKEGKEYISKNNPIVVADKMIKI